MSRIRWAGHLQTITVEINPIEYSMADQIIVP